MRSRRIIVGLFVLALVTAAVLWCTREREPHYNGQSLYYWIPLCSGSSGPSRWEANQAIRAMGTNAVPYLIDALRQKPRLWQEKVQLLAARWNIQDEALPSAGRRRDDAGAALEILGPLAVGAVEPLTQMLTNHADPEGAVWAARCLGHIGGPGVPLLLSALTNGALPTKRASISGMSALGTNAHPFIKSLVSCSQETNAEIRRYTALTLGCLNLQPEHTVPALGKMLQDPDPEVRGFTACALSSMGTNAFPVVPLLLATLQDTNREVRLYAAITIKELKPPGDQVLHALLKGFYDHPIQQIVKSALLAYGTNAQPYLEKAKVSSEPGVRTAAQSVLDTLQGKDQGHPYE